MIENRRNRANVAVHPSANLPPDLRSCSRRLEIGKGPRTKDRWKIPPSVSKVETIAERGKLNACENERPVRSLKRRMDVTCTRQPICPRSAMVSLFYPFLVERLGRSNWRTISRLLTSNAGT